MIAKATATRRTAGAIKLKKETTSERRAASSLLGLDGTEGSTDLVVHVFALPSIRIELASRRARPLMFKVQSKMCATCIYRPDSSLDLKKLEGDVRDPYMGFKGHRICHHSKDVCCRGFWNAHKNEFPVGQIAQRLGLVEFVQVDTLLSRKQWRCYAGGWGTTHHATEQAARRRARRCELDTMRMSGGPACITKVWRETK